ncbi:hypothetical protein OF83DRAFT_1070479, partial [Amylostereum chailletii]
RNFRKANWEAMREELKDNLDQEDALAEYKEGEKERFDSDLTLFMQTIDDAIRNYVPIAKITLYSKQWWTPELTAERKEVR